MMRPQPGAVFNVADDEPATREAVLAFAAGLANIGNFVDPGRSRERARRARTEHKRVRSRRVRSELGYRLQYRDFREGLQQVAAVEASAAGGVLGGGKGNESRSARAGSSGLGGAENTLR